ncbi:hypothetical protein DPMN_163949 [Dreissena polymorpha]|uniref:C1q domain-containing protein n=1 Tax=Dreissena polymorpha TaxID=45954 RepID=A0A9D4IUX3_DREPO|nr:hypothetical protein DPMN_163949 [Dreissena polymorpha]
MLQLIMLFAFGLILASAEANQSRFVNELDLPEIVQQLDALTKRFNDLEAKYNHGPIAFKASLTRAVSPGPNQRIIFDDVKLNLGNAYNHHLGGFVAPLNGTYLFSVYVCSAGGHYIALDLLRNSEIIGKVQAGDERYTACSSETTIDKLNAGDAVYVQHHGGSGDLVHVQEDILNSFTGSLLQVV